jgi:hypothetical protein
MNQLTAEQDQVVRTLRGLQFQRERHGSLYDRGSADSYYSRVEDPHWYPQGTGRGERITNLNPEEIAEYQAGYEDNELHGDKKSWD